MRNHDNRRRILRAICAGYRRPRAICASTKIPLRCIRSYLSRLKRAGLIAVLSRRCSACGNQHAIAVPTPKGRASL